MKDCGSRSFKLVQVTFALTSPTKFSCMARGLLRKHRPILSLDQLITKKTIFKANPTHRQTALRVSETSGKSYFYGKGLMWFRSWLL